MARKIPQILTDAPVTQLYNWAGYSAKKDKTMLPANYLVSPSQNCFIPDGDKIVPRFGTQTVFQGPSNILNVGIIGGYTKFKNFAGIDMDVKAYRDPIQGEQILVLFNGVYIPITLSTNTSLNGTGRIYMSTYLDTDLDLSENKRVPRLCWVNGYEHSDGTGRVFSWTGGIAVIDSVTPTTISLPVGVTWKSLGFTTNYTGPNTPPNAINVVINGVQYSSSNLSELDTNTLTIGAHSITAGLVVTSAVEVDSLVSPMDILKQNKNYMYYGNWKYRQWWMSNQFGRPATTRVLNSNATMDDLSVVNQAYNGTGLKQYKVTITDVDPATPAISIDTQRFVLASGEEQTAGGLFNGYWNTSGYNGPNGTYTYKLLCVADYVVTGVGGTASPAPGNSAWFDQVFVGQTSGAIGLAVGGQYAVSIVTPMRMISGVFLDGEIIRGVSSGAQVQVLSNQSSNHFQAFRDGDQIISAPFNIFPPWYFYQANLNQTILGNPIAILDGITFTFGNPISLSPGDYYELTIERKDAYPGSNDEFRYQVDNGPQSSPISITGSPQSLGAGFQIQFANTRGHTVGDSWIIEVNQKIARPWANFYYSLDLITQFSVRRPGEGYIYSLPSNFWTMDTFEDSIYVNTSNGEWGYTTPTLSADLLSEDISFTPLKQVVASKVLYPYLTGHNRNDLIFIDEDKNLTSIGRIQLMEKVQMKDMSDFVLDLFRSLSFVDGSIMFQGDKTWITSPNDNIMVVFDERTGYWQPPQYIPNLGILTIISNNLYTHSTLNTATRSLNDPTAVGDDGVEYEVIARSSTFDHGNRWNKKTANMAFWEGRVSENPPMKMNIYFDVDGCSGVKSTDILPVFCTGVINNGNFGGSQDGGHEFGGDQTYKTDYARYLYDKMGVHHFYFSSSEFYCRTKKHPYEIFSMGINLSESKYNNKEFRSPESNIDNLLPI